MLEARIYKVGRSSSNDWVLDDSTVLPFHAEIFIDPHGNVFFSPLNPQAVCYLNEKLVVQPVILEKGMCLRLGSCSVDWERKLFGSTPPPIVPKVKPNTNRSKENRDLILIYGLILLLLLFLNLIV
jgi:pSer/pThr/pTyr-binding forkhead associated (FHA) protein